VIFKILTFPLAAMIYVAEKFFDRFEKAWPKLK
jgi:hypothetical protein